MMTEKKAHPDPSLDQRWNSLESRFISTPTACPYNLPFPAIYRQAGFKSMPDPLFERFLNSGYRRNGNVLYTMCCKGCKACIPIRIKTKEFQPNRNQKRVLKRNHDLTMEFAPLYMGKEQLDLCRRFLKARFPESSGSPDEYYSGFFINSICRTFEIRYRLAGKLMGVGIIDLGPDWLNCVYFFFEPTLGKKSPGTYNILYLLDFCRQQGISTLYLGYWLQEITAMKYKANFTPHQLLIDGQWHSLPQKDGVTRSLVNALT